MGALGGAVLVEQLQAQVARRHRAIAQVDEDGREVGWREGRDGGHEEDGVVPKGLGRVRAERRGVLDGRKAVDGGVGMKGEHTSGRIDLCQQVAAHSHAS